MGDLPPRQPISQRIVHIYVKNCVTVCIYSWNILDMLVANQKLRYRRIRSNRNKSNIIASSCVVLFPKELLQPCTRSVEKVLESIEIYELTQNVFFPIHLVYVCRLVCSVQRPTSALFCWHDNTRSKVQIEPKPQNNHSSTPIKFGHDRSNRSAEGFH